MPDNDNPLPKHLRERALERAMAFMTSQQCIDRNTDPRSTQVIIQHIYDKMKQLEADVATGGE